MVVVTVIGGVMVTTLLCLVLIALVAITTIRYFHQSIQGILYLICGRGQRSRNGMPMYEQNTVINLLTPGLRSKG